MANVQSVRPASASFKEIAKKTTLWDQWWIHSLFQVWSLLFQFYFQLDANIPGFGLASQISIQCQQSDQQTETLCSSSIALHVLSAMQLKSHILWTAWFKCLRPKRLWNMSNVELLHECKANMTVALLSLTKCSHSLVPTSSSLKTNLSMSTRSLEVDLSARSKIFTTSAASMVKTSAIWSMDIPFIPQELQTFNERDVFGTWDVHGCARKMISSTNSFFHFKDSKLDGHTPTNMSLFSLLSLCKCTPFTARLLCDTVTDQLHKEGGKMICVFTRDLWFLPHKISDNTNAQRQVCCFANKILRYILPKNKWCNVGMFGPKAKPRFNSSDVVGWFDTHRFSERNWP